MVDHTSSSVEELKLDLENGLNSSDEDESSNFISCNGRRKKTLTRAKGGHFSVDNFVTGAKYCGYTSENIELLVDNSSDQSQDKCKRTASRKPPRPPKGPTLDSADMKIVREMAELAMRKRSRIERIRALRKSRGAKFTLSSSSSLSSSRSSSSSLITTLLAMVITLIFALLMFFKGI